MKVVLQKDVKEIGRIGDLINVSEGYARNFLFPKKLAVEATETKVKEWEHLKRVSEIKKKKAVSQRQEILNKMNGVTVHFKLAAGENDKLFGTVSPKDISNELEKLGYSVDKRDIHLEEHIKLLGQHKATVRLGEGQEAVIQISIEKA
ncbi:MAG TPA: 50S ribosomal protein L9 [Pseudobdellovibrionaceae bacterium]|nr:50S ribosomal protein L9 [Pseudobdellovibrionaceae bacterium]